MKVKSILGFGVGPIVTGFFGLITIPIVAWVFSPEDVGRFNIFQVSLTFFLLFGTLALDQAYVREFHGSESRHQLLKECLIPGIVFQLIVLCLLLKFSDFALEKLFDLSGFIYMLIISFCVIINFISRFLSLILRMNERGLDYSLSQITPKFVQTILLLLVARFIEDTNFLLIILIATIAVSVNLVILVIQNKKDILLMYYSKISFLNIGLYLKFSLPLIFSGLIFWGISASTVFSIKQISTLNELAIFSVAMSFSAVAAIIQSIFSVIWTPLAFKWQESGVDMERVDYVADSVLVIICIVISSVGTLSFLIDYILPETYSNVKYIVPCLILPPLLYTMSVVTSIGIGIMRANKFSLYASIGALAVNITSCILLIDDFGASGAAISNSLSFLMLFIINTEASAFVWRDFPRRKIYLIIFMLTFVAIANSIAYLNKVVNFNVVWLTVLIAMLLLFNNKIKELAKNFAAYFFRSDAYQRE